MDNSELRKAAIQELARRELARRAEGKEVITDEDKPGHIARTVSRFARPALEIGGAVGGAALAGGASAPTVAGFIPGAMVGGGLGFAGGKTAADYLDRKLGILPPVEGGITGAIKTTGENLLEGAKSEALGLGLGAALSGGMKLAGAAGKRLISSTLGPSVKDVSARFTRNAEIKAAKPIEDIAREFPDDVQVLSDHVSNLSGKALDLLSPEKYLMEGAQAKDTILQAVKRERKNIGRSVSDASVQAKKVLDRYAYRLKRLGNTVSEQELGKIVRDIDNDIDWVSKDMTPLNNALEGVRRHIDGLLKGQNKAYEAAMVPVAEGTRLLKKIQTIFQIENDVGRGFKPKNATATALKGAIERGRAGSQEALEGLRKVTGRDYLREIENSTIAEKFLGGRAQGSRRVNLGAIVGMGLGGGVGSLLGMPGTTLGTIGGGMTGAYLDTEGSKIAGGLIDRLVKMGVPDLAKKTISPTFRRVLSAAGIAGSEQ